MIYSSWGIQQNILKLVILGHFLSFYPLKTPKIKTLKNEKICWRYRHFTHVFQKPYSYDVRFLWYRARQIEFFVILGHFLSFYPTWWSQKSKLKRKKKMKKMPGDIILLCIHVNHEWRSYDIYDSWNIRCDRLKFLSIWVIFGPFTPLHYFTHVYHKWQSCDVWFLRYRAQ